MRNSDKMEEKIIGIGKIDIAFQQGTLTTIGLGSCVGVMLYDKVNKIGGMAHVMLPHSKESNFDQPNKTILLSEHDPHLRQQLKGILERSEYNIGEEADEAFETVRKYDKLTMGLIVMSRYIPEIQGIETMRMLREKDTESKVILLSDHLDHTTYMELIEQGANDVIVHPFNEQTVLGITDFVVLERHIRFADVAIPILVSRIKNLGGNHLEAKLIGGANIFPSIHTQNIGEIGHRNIESVKYELSQLQIPILAEDLGDHYGRTARFDIATGTVKVKTKDKEYEL